MCLDHYTAQMRRKEVPRCSNKVPSFFWNIRWLRPSPNLLFQYSEATSIKSWKSLLHLSSFFSILACQHFVRRIMAHVMICERERERKMKKDTCIEATVRGWAWDAFPRKGTLLGDQPSMTDAALIILVIVQYFTKCRSYQQQQWSTNKTS